MTDGLAFKYSSQTDSLKLSSRVRVLLSGGQA